MKYEITDIVHPDNPKLKRIRALKDFSNVKVGELGGWIESEKNLSQDGKCWVYGEAQVYGNALVSDDALVYDDAQVYGNAQVGGNAKVYFNACVVGNAVVSGWAGRRECNFKGRK